MWCRRNLGISLVEFVVALAVVAIATIYAAPMFYMIVNNQRATSFANELVAALTYARVQAVRRGYPVSVCSSNDAQSCTDTPWGQGYIVFLDTGMAGVVDTGDTVLRQHQIRQPHVSITLSGARYVRFQASGATIARYLDSADSSSAFFTAETRFDWLDRLLPVASAHADISVARPTRVISPGGFFTVCAGHAGRVVKLSPQGFISTSSMKCQ